MLLKELLQGLDVVETNVDLAMSVGEICSDTRKITKDCLFVCLKGLKLDAHTKAAEAIASGAKVIVCQSPVEEGLPFVRVKDTREAFSRLHANGAGNPQTGFRHCIALTGTNGKTSTSFMIREIFRQAGVTTGLIGTMKYMIGDREYPLDADKNVLTTPDPDVLFPLLKTMRDSGVEVLIMETSSHALKLNKLCGMHFDLGIFTNFTQDHLDFHGGMEDYLSSKKKLFSMCDKALINFDDPSFDKIVKDLPCPYMTFSGAENNKADFIAKNVRLKNEQGVEYEMLTKEDIFRVRVPIPGQFSVSNSLAAASCAWMLGISREPIVAALLQMENVKGRIDRVKLDAPYSVFIDFAHTPDAMENVLKTIRQFARGRIIALFGCGGDRDRTKRPRMAQTAAALSDVVVVTSDNSRSEEKGDIIRDILVGMENTSTPYHVIEDRSEAIRFAMDLAQEGDVILLAGKGHEEYEIDKTGKHPYSERQVVLDYYEKKRFN